MDQVKPIGEKRTLPGKRSAELLSLRNQYVPKAVFQTVPVFIARGSGVIVEDVDGNEYLDFAAGISALNIGHCHEKVIAEVKEQLYKYSHTSFNVLMYEPYVQLAKKLTEITPGGFTKQVLLKNSGAEAVDDAVKIARAYSGKKGIICFEGSYHGRTQLATALTSQVKYYKFGFDPFDPYVHRFPFPYGYRAPFGINEEEYATYCIEKIEDSFKNYLANEDIAAVIFEPYQGEGGFVFPPSLFVKGLREICDKYSLIMIADEIQSGMGRTGRTWAIEHFDVIPDILVTSKSLGGGTVISAVVSKKMLVDSINIGGLGGTFGGNPLSCVAALKSIEILHEDKLLDRVRKLGKYAKERLMTMKEKHPIIGDVRGIGLALAIELVKDCFSKDPASEETKEILRKCHEHGLIIMPCGPFKNIIRMMPPLVISRDELEKGLDILENAVSDVNGLI
ncbi:aspartate aminotransferase family protein [Chloroflexota bacterium]